MFSRAFILILLALILMFPSTAHLEGGKDIVVGQHVVDIGYDRDTLVSLRPTFFLIALKHDDEAVADAQKLWVRIKNDKGIMLAATFYPEPSGAYSFTTMFPDVGEYEITTRFTTEDGVIQTTTTLDVDGRPSTMVNSQRIFFIAVLLAVAVFIALCIKNNNKKNDKINKNNQTVYTHRRKKS